MKPKKSKGMGMSRSESRKYKRYRQTHPLEKETATPTQNHKGERHRYFGDIQPHREDGVVDLTPYNAAIGQELISTVKYDIARHIIKRRGRPLKQRALEQ